MTPVLNVTNDSRDWKFVGENYIELATEFFGKPLSDKLSELLAKNSDLFFTFDILSFKHLVVWIQGTYPIIETVSVEFFSTAILLLGIVLSKYKPRVVEFLHQSTHYYSQLDEEGRGFFPIFYDQVKCPYG